jgi:hypothetical protein
VERVTWGVLSSTRVFPPSISLAISSVGFWFGSMGMVGGVRV